MTRIQLDTGFVDLPKGTDFPIDLSFAEITKSGARSGGVSRSLEIEGSENNTILLGSYFDIDLSNDTFDRNKKTTCSVIQNGVEVFEGFIQLKEITRVNKLRGTNRKLVKYKIEVFDEVSNFFNEMGDKELTELSFPEFSHVFNRANIIASWSNTEGYTYPQYAKSDNIYTLRDFKPAIYEFEYFKKIFAANGYTFTFPQFDDDNIRMHKRVVPYNGKQGEDTIGQFLKQAFTVRGEMSSANYVIDASNTPTYPIGWLPFIDYISGTGTNSYATAAGSKVILSDIFEDAQNQWSFATDDLQNKAGASRTFQVLTSYEYNVQVKSEAGTAWQVEVGSGLSRCEIKLTLVAQSTTNPNKVAYIDAGQTIIDFDSGTHTYGSGLQSLASGENASFANIGVFDANEKFDVHVLIYARYFGVNGNVIQNGGQFQSLNSLSVDDLNVTLQTEFVETSSGDPVRLEFDIDITNLQFKAIPDITELVKGSNVDISQFIPKKIKQRDLISAISKSYNLVFVPDPENEKNIIIKTRDKYYQDGQEWDWTEKFAEDQPNNITFLSNDVKQKQAYKYTDDRDELNSAYQGEFVESYGQTTIQLDNEYTVGTDERIIIYSPTPSVGSAIGVPLPSINGVNPECNIRVLLHNGSGTVAPYPFYDDLLPNPNEFELVEDYCKTSMFDDDVFPNFSICFDAPNILFHGFQQGQTTNYLYQLQHQQELTTINEGERLVGYFDLTEGDFQKLSKRLDYKIFIKDNGWFFISNIAGYNSGKRTLTKVDLVTADEKTRLKFKKPKKPIKLTAFNAVDPIKNHFYKVAQDTNVIISEGYVSIDGKYNFVAADNVNITGNQNKVLSGNSVVIGNYNEIGTGLGGIRLIGDNKTPSFTESYTGGTMIPDLVVPEGGGINGIDIAKLLNTNVVSGAGASINAGDNTKFDFQIVGEIVDPTDGTVTNIDVELTAQTVTNLATHKVTYIAVKKDGTIEQKTTPFSNTELVSRLGEWVLIHSNLTNLNAVNQFPERGYSLANQLHSMMRNRGMVNVVGNDVTPNGTNLSINVSAGTLERVGVNPANIGNPNEIDLGTLTAPSNMRARTQGTYESSDTAFIDTTNYDNGTVTPVTIPSANQFQTIRIARFSSNLIRYQYGQTLYGSMAEALANLTDPYVVEKNIAENGCIIALLIVRKGTTDLTDTSRAKFIKVGRNGSTNASLVPTFQNVYEVSPQPQIKTNSTIGAVQIEGGTGSDSDINFEILNNAGTSKFGITANGDVFIVDAVASVSNSTEANPTVSLENTVISQPVLKLTNASTGLALDVIQGGVRYDFANSGSVTVNLTENDHILEATNIASVVNLPATSKNGLNLIVKYTGIGACTITPNGTDTIDGAATLVLTPNQKANLIFGSGNNWITI